MHPLLCRLHIHNSISNTVRNSLLCVCVCSLYSVEVSRQLCKIVLDIPALSGLKNGAGKQYRGVALHYVSSVFQHHVIYGLFVVVDRK